MKTKRRVKLIAVESESDFGHPSLKARMARAPNVSGTERFKAIADDRAVGFVFVDMSSDVDEAILGELFVISEDRRKGFGTAILKSIEDYVVSVGHRSLKLSPWPVSPDSPSISDLEKWYVSCGYSLVPGVDRMFEKNLAV